MSKVWEMISNGLIIIILLMLASEIGLVLPVLAQMSPGESRYSGGISAALDLGARRVGAQQKRGGEETASLSTSMKARSRGAGNSCTPGAGFSFWLFCR